MPRPLRDSIYLYGLHDPGGEQHMLDLGAPGWVLVTEAIGYDANDTGGRDYRPLSDRDLGVLVRLNAGYARTGTLPYERFYPQFAQRCANFVRNSPGAHHWIVGNETNHPIEWPGADWDWNAAPPEPRSPDRMGEPITAARYAACYKAVRAAIKAVPGHAADLVLVGGVAPWNALLVTPDNPTGDWITYFKLILDKIGAANCDGITLHTYTHGASPGLIGDETTMNAPFKTRRYHFRAYRDFMAAIPAAMRGLPIFITETDQGDIEWQNHNSGWVRAAYAEIDAWNRSNAQKIRSLVLYRWTQVDGDRWGIAGKAGLIDDFKAAVGQRFKWDVGEDIWTILRRKVEALEQSAAGLAADAAALPQLLADSQKLRQAVSSIPVTAGGYELRGRFEALVAELTRLEEQVAAAGAGSGAGGGTGAGSGAGTGSGGTPQPALHDCRGKLPTGAAAPYPTRSESAIKRIVVHHTATRSDITPERLAAAQVAQGRPGITYHFLVSGDGTLSWTQPLDAVVAQATKAEINADAVAVALAGNFTSAAPPDAQLDAAAALIAWLCGRFGLTTAQVMGRRELEAVASPGNQWVQGAAFKVPLLAKVQAALDAAADQQEETPSAELLRLRELVATLEAQAKAQAGQVQALQARIAELEQLIATREAEIARLRDLVAAGTGGRVARPQIVDVVDALPKHPTLPPYRKRTVPVTMLVIHHTDTTKDYTVQKLAQYHVYGERKKADGTVLKGPWPGLGYHFVIAADGVIYQGQREDTVSYHVGGDPNGYAIGISLIGRFMSTDLKGQPQAAENQIPTPQQLRSAGQLAAWLMQEYKIPIARVVGHRDVWPKSTVCPGEHWKTGQKWWTLLQREIEAVQQGQAAGKMEHYLLLWDHGDDWAQADWRNAQDYVEHFRPTSGFSVDDALLARNVTIVGGEAGVSGADEQRLIAAGATTRRLAGKDETETRSLLAKLAADETLWPGATPRPPQTRDLAATAVEITAEAPEFDEWTLLPDWAPPAGAEAGGAGEDANYRRVKAPLPA